MKKLTLNVEELAVEQFATEVAIVQAEMETKWWSGCNVGTCYC